MSSPAPARAARPHHRRGPSEASPSAEGGEFEALGVPPELCRALANQSIHTPFPIQVASLPDSLAGLPRRGTAILGGSPRGCSSVRKSASVASKKSWVRIPSPPHIPSERAREISRDPGLPELKRLLERHLLAASTAVDTR